MYRPCDLDLWHMKVNFCLWIENDPVSVLYDQIDISTNSPEIKYQNMGTGHFMRNINCGIGILHVKRQILTYFCDVISLLAQVFIVSSNRVS